MVESSTVSSIAFVSNRGSRVCKLPLPDSVYMGENMYPSHRPERGTARGQEMGGAEMIGVTSYQGRGR